MSQRWAAVERVLSLSAPVRAGEGKAVLLLLLKGFLLLSSYYLLKPVREALILTEGTAELRSYAVAVQALVLLGVIPLYNAFYRRVNRVALIRWITLFLCSNLLVFYVLGRLDTRIGFAFFVWLGIFSILIVAQFWAFAADLYNVESGQRLFAIIAIGASLGAFVGSMAAKSLFAALGPFGLMLLALCGLLLTLPLSPRAAAAIPEGSRNQQPPPYYDAVTGVLKGFQVVLTDRYLRLIALFVILLNWVNTTGEYILAKYVVMHAESMLATGTGVLTKGQIIGEFYSGFFAWVNILGLLMQLFMVYRVYRFVGIHGALLVLPVVSLFGYASVALLPVAAAIVAVKVIENSVDYSLLNTTRHALFLPVPRELKYSGKTAIDTFFWRIGDLTQAGVVYLGSAVLGLGITAFAAFNAVLAVVWLVAARAIGRGYQRLVS
jgi:AAA family ATP:ADP antiporter